MPQSYKLRLSDGTLLAVDLDGLRAWQTDEGATVQTRTGWRPLKDALAQEGAPRPDDGIIPLKPESPPSERPSLRFAQTDDEELDGDLYDGDLYDQPSFRDVMWRWMKRIVLTTGLVAGGLYAVATRESWLPKAEQLGIQAVTELDKRVHPPSPPTPSAEEIERRQLEEALTQATEQLPHLAPETIQLLMASSMGGVLEPPEVFRRAYDAVERGRSSLAPEEAQELKTLQSQVLAALHPGERALVREYDAVRGVRVTLPFEDRDVLRLIARGTSALPPHSRKRLRELSGKAIAAAPAGTAVPPRAARRESPAA